MHWRAKLAVNQWSYRLWRFDSVPTHFRSTTRMAEYANWQSGHVEGVAILQVRLLPDGLGRPSYYQRTIPWSKG